MDLEKTIKNLKVRGFGVQHFATGEEAAAYLCEQVKDTTVGIGGCMTAHQLGLYPKLSENNTVYWHWVTPGMETLEKANHAAVYICSANAMTEDGEIINMDGRGNRLAGSVFGEKKLYYVVSTKKICPDFQSAVDRAHNTAAVTNAKRFPGDQPCQKDGKCHDCRHPARICRVMLVTMMPVMPTEVILIDEDFGY